MLKHDKEILWRPGRCYIPIHQFAGLAYEATTGNAIKSIGTGTPTATNLATNEVNTSGIVGMLLTTSGNSVSHLMEVPYDMDLTKPLYAAIHWTANNTSGSTLWTLTYKAFAANSTVLGSAEAATAFSSALAAHTMAGVAYTWMRTPEARLNGGVLADTTELLQITVAMTTLVTITQPLLLGMSLRWTPRRLQGNTGMLYPSKAATYIQSNKYAN